MAVAQKKIWAFHDGPMVGLFVGKSPGPGTNVAEFIRADVANARIRELESALNRISADAAWTPKHPACEKILETAAAVLRGQSN